MKSAWQWALDMVREMDKAVQRNGGWYRDLSHQRRPYRQVVDDAGDKGTDTTCVSAEGAHFVCEKCSPTCLESSRGWHGQDQDLFPENPGLSWMLAVLFAWGHPCSPTTAHSLLLCSILPKPKGECADSVHPYGWGMFHCHLLGASSYRSSGEGDGGPMKRPFPCWINAGHSAWCHLHSSCFGRSPEPSRALFPWHSFNGQDGNRP